MVSLKQSSVDLGSTRRWLRRTNVYIAEYIIMLALVGGFVGLLVSMWFSLFGMMYGGSPLLNVGVVAQLGAIIVVAPAAYWMYARVTGQEMVQPELYTRTSRTVFLTLWLLGAVPALVGLGVTLTTAIIGSIVGSGDVFTAVFVSILLPALLSIATILLGIMMVVKHASRKFVMTAGQVLAVTAIVLFIGNFTFMLIHRDAMQSPGQINTSIDSVDDCTTSRYLNDDCSYSDYRHYNYDTTNRYQN